MQGTVYKYDWAIQNVAIRQNTRLENRVRKKSVKHKKNDGSPLIVGKSMNTRVKGYKLQGIKHESTSHFKLYNWALGIY
jgi:hypothetical protein